eukprot:1312823-Amphidinium_carterae.2
MVASVDCWARQQRVSVSHLHVDLKSAFDVIVRQLLVGPHSEPGQMDDADNAEDLTIAQMCNMASFFERHTLPLLEGQGVPSALCDVLRNMETGLWARLPGIPGVPGEDFAGLPTGVRQGCTLSPWLFAVYLAAATRDIDAALAEAGLDWSIPSFSGFTGATSTAADTEASVERAHIAFNSLLYADDIVCLRVAQDGQMLLRQNRRILQIVKLTFQKYSLRINQAAGKTELAIHFVTQASELKAGIMADTQQRGESKPSVLLDDGTALYINNTYLYLGKWTSPACKQAKEIRCRRGYSLAALKEIGSVLKSTEVPLRLKVEACATYALSRFTFCIGTHNLCTQAEMKMLQRAYYKLLYVAVRLHLKRDPERPHVSYVELAKQSKMPTFMALLYGRVLSLFSRIATSQCRLTHSVLALASGADGSWQGIVVHALTWLKETTHKFDNSPTPSTHTHLKIGQTLSGFWAASSSTLPNRLSKTHATNYVLRPRMQAWTNPVIAMQTQHPALSMFVRSVTKVVLQQRAWPAIEGSLTALLIRLPRRSAATDAAAATGSMAPERN